MNRPKAIVIRTAGTNCDYETQRAFEIAGAHSERVHINRLISGEVKLADFKILAVPGGFSYGDDIASGKILANELKNKLGKELNKFALSGKPIIGICNGFQVLVKMGLLPDPKSFKQTTTLTFNDSDKFECRWINLKNGALDVHADKPQGFVVAGAPVKKVTKKKNKCLWTNELPDIIQLPVAHGEGKFVSADKKILDELEKNSQIVLRYCDPKGALAGYPYNPNGAVNNIAGICNSKGNVFGLMPHPERFIYKWQHPNHNSHFGNSEFGWGFKIFRNAVDYVK